LKEKLKKFTAFSRHLLPHESAYLLEVLKTEDEDKISIMQKVHENALKVDAHEPFDTSIDKRKYSSLLKWMKIKLDKVDIDSQLRRIVSLHRDILLDTINDRGEQEISQMMRTVRSNAYNFIRFYDMLLEYRQYLIIRMRYKDHARIHQFIEKYKFDFQKSKLINEQMHQASNDIVGDSNASGIQWGKWLKECFYNSSLDGYNRYMAFVRLSFIYLKHDMLREMEEMLYKDAELLFKNGLNYSRRLLLNYYDNMLVLYDKMKDYEKARYFGYLSIRDFNQDSIIYVNNLVNVLIKMKLTPEALSIIDGIDFKIKMSKNMHSAIGFVSNHIRCLSLNNETDKAILKAKVFLSAYSKDILNYRWHRFFVSYISAMVKAKQFHDALKLMDRFKLVAREEEYAQLSGGRRTIQVFQDICLYQLNKLKTSDLVAKWEFNKADMIEEHVIQGFAESLSSS
jgi:hypothetical protein